METLNFRPEPFAGFEFEANHGCGCDSCKGKHADETLEFETTSARAWCKDLPGEVKKCFKVGEETRKLCAKGHVDPCKPIPEVWHSKTVGNVPFHYGMKTKKVGGRLELLGVKSRNHGVKIVPATWMATLKWTAMMTGFGMPLDSVIHAGAGPYCRCVKSPPKICHEDNADACTGTVRSDHGTANAIDISALVWKSKELVRSSVRGTIVKNWRDPEQAKVLVRVNAALRLVYPTVIDWSDHNGRHDDHFHVDTVDDRKGQLFAFTEPAFVAGCLRRLGYSTATGKGTTDECFDALPALARQMGIAVPASKRDHAGWRAIINTLYACVASGSSCRKS
jgi:hypothetical protein